MVEAQATDNRTMAILSGTGVAKWPPRYAPNCESSAPVPICRNPIAPEAVPAAWFCCGGGAPCFCEAPPPQPAKPLVVLLTTQRHYALQAFDHVGVVANIALHDIDGVVENFVDGEGHSAVDGLNTFLGGIDFLDGEEFERV